MAESAVELELECAVCLEPYRDPVILPCEAGHNLCLGCAGGRVVYDRRAGRVRCPQCREEHPLGSLDELRRNLVLRNVADSYRRELAALGARPAAAAAAPARPGRCAGCDGEAEAVFECAACSLRLCSPCAEERPHPPPGHAAVAGHRLLPLGTRRPGDDEDAPPPHLCPDHPQYALDLYCTECGVPACAHCLLVGDHRDHAREPAAAAVVRQRGALERGAAEFRARAREIEGLSATLEALRDRIHENGARTRDEVRGAFARLRADLDARERDMLAHADAVVEEKAAALDDQRERLAETARLAGNAAGRAEAAVRDAGGDAVLLLLRAPAALSRLRTARGLCFRPEEPAVRLPSLGLTVYRPRLAGAVRAFHFEQVVGARRARELRAGQWVDCRDSVGRWQRAVITDRKRQRLSGVEAAKVHFDGWGHRWDEWIPVASPRLAPYGLVTGDMAPDDLKGAGPRPGDERYLG